VSRKLASRHSSCITTELLLDSLTQTALLTGLHGAGNEPANRLESISVGRQQSYHGTPLWVACQEQMIILG
jgi:hypothetical protein